MGRWLRIFIMMALCILQGGFAIAQEKEQTYFTVGDGLPSNYIYRILEDDRGFLWLPTMGGVARFDGKYFQVFTTKDGLPDNEVFSIVKEKDGRIWAECFNQVPAYFDETQNRFVVPYLPPELAARMINTLGTYLRPMPDGGIVYANRDRAIVFKNGKQKKYGPLIDNRLTMTPINEYADGSVLASEGVKTAKIRNGYQLRLYHIKGQKIVDTFMLTKMAADPKNIDDVLKRNAVTNGLIFDNADLYIGIKNLNKLYIHRDIQINPLRLKTDSLLLPERYVNYFFSSDRLSVVTESGTIYVYDKKHLKLIETIRNKHYLVNSYFNDSHGNEWISTLDKGLILRRNAALKPVPLPEHISNRNFLSISSKPDGTILAGNYYGEVVEISKGKALLHQVITKSPARIRKIIVAGGKMYTFSEEGIYSDFKKRIPDPDNALLSFGKTALWCNDSLILVATNRNLFGLNPKTNRQYTLRSPLLRVMALVKSGPEWAYLGSINGLYKYNFKTNSNYIPLSKVDARLSKRVVSLYYSPDGLLWVIQADNTILALKNDRIILTVHPDNALIASLNKHLNGYRPGQLWVSTSNGITVINYSLNAGKISYVKQYISAKDGLAGNEVEEIYYKEGNLYVATNNGISIVPENYVAPKTNIPTYLIQAYVNQQETRLSHDYQLAYDQRDVQMRFAGVNLNGYFGFFQYKLDDGKSWAKLQGNTLNIQLRPGRHILFVRAVDVNGHVSPKRLTITFNVAVPFWLNVWFWLIVGLMVQLLLMYGIGRRQKKRKEAKLAKKIAAVQTAALEQQAFTSLMNPHFMFNALNSIQHYINVQDRQNANRYLSDFASLIRKNFEAAQESFIALEEELEHIKLYLNLEQMRFDGKFEYKITIDKALDIEDWMMPTMILQPLLENAVLHGIMPSTIPGKLIIRFKLIHDDLMITITDNGIGLMNSQALKANSSHKSSGMGLIQKRIKALSDFSTQPITFHMEPAYKRIKNPGNKITLIIPAALFLTWLQAKKQL